MNNWVVVQTTYGGYEASVGVYGAYTHEEAVEKLRELTGEPLLEPDMAFGGFDWDNGHSQFIIVAMGR